MADTNSVDVILNFLRRNRFTRAEAALRGELNNRPDLNGFLQKLTLEDKDSGIPMEGENGDKPVVENQGSGSRSSSEVSKELVVKEIQCGTGRNGSESDWKNAASTGERNKPDEALRTCEKGFTFSKGSEDTLLDLYSWKFNPSNGNSNPYQSDGGTGTIDQSELGICERTKHQAGEISADTGKSILNSGEDINVPGDRTNSWLGSTSKANLDPKYDKTQISEPKELDQQLKTGSEYFKENFTDNLWSRSEEAAYSSSELWKDCSVKTVFPSSKGDVSTSYDSVSGIDKKEGKRKSEVSDIRAAIKEQVDEVGRALYFSKSQGSTEQKPISSLVFPLVSDNQKEEFPRLPPVKLKSEDKSLNIKWEEKFERDGPGTKLSSHDNTLFIGSYLDVPVGQEISSGLFM